MSREDPDVIDSVARAFSVMEAFDVDHPFMTLSEAAERTGLTRATSRRILLTLVRLGFATQADRGFQLTPRVLRLGYAYLASTPVAELAQPHLLELADRVRESCSMATLDAGEIVYLARVPAKRSMTIVLGIGARLPAYPTSMGRVLLAALSTQALETYLAETPLVALTTYTITDPGELREEISAVARRGWAVVDQEREVGVRSVAAPVKNKSGRVVAAVNISVNAARLSVTQLVDDVVPLLQQTAGAISSDLSHGSVGAG